VSRQVTDQMLKLARAMRLESINVAVKSFADHFDVRPY
jgi:hypothetical protein